MNTRRISRFLFAAGILVSMATFVLGALPANWGIFLSAACFVIGGMIWPDWDSAGKNNRGNSQ